MIHLASKNSSYASIPVPRSIQPSDTMKFWVYSCYPTPWHHSKTMKTFIHTSTVREHDLAQGAVQRDQTDLLGSWDRADVENPAQKEPRVLQRSCACRKPCHESLSSSILKLTRGLSFPHSFQKLKSDIRIIAHICTQDCSCNLGKFLMKQHTLWLVYFSLFVQM